MIIRHPYNNPKDAYTQGVIRSIEAGKPLVHNGFSNARTQVLMACQLPIDFTRIAQAIGGTRFGLGPFDAWMRRRLERVLVTHHPDPADPDTKRWLKI